MPRNKRIIFENLLYAYIN